MQRRLFCVAIISWSSYLNVLHVYFVVEVFVGIYIRYHVNSVIRNYCSGVEYLKISRAKYSQSHFTREFCEKFLHRKFNYGCGSSVMAHAVLPSSLIFLLKICPPYPQLVQPYVCKQVLQCLLSCTCLQQMVSAFICLSLLLHSTGLFSTFCLP